MDLNEDYFYYIYNNDVLQIDIKNKTVFKYADFPVVLDEKLYLVIPDGNIVRIEPVGAIQELPKTKKRSSKKKRNTSKKMRSSTSNKKNISNPKNKRSLKKKRGSSKKSSKKVVGAIHELSIETINFVAKDVNIYEYNKKEKTIEKKDVYKGETAKDKLIIIDDKNNELKIEITVGAYRNTPKIKKRLSTKNKKSKSKKSVNNIELITLDLNKDLVKLISLDEKTTKKRSSSRKKKKEISSKPKKRGLSLKIPDPYKEITTMQINETKTISFGPLFLEMKRVSNKDYNGKIVIKYILAGKDINANFTGILQDNGVLTLTSNIMNIAKDLPPLKPFFDLGIVNTPGQTTFSLTIDPNKNSNDPKYKQAIISIPLDYIFLKKSSIDFQ